MGLSRNKVAVGESAAGSPPITAHKCELLSDWKPKGHRACEDGLQSEHQGLVDQLEDRCLCKAEALGSSPSESIEMVVHQVSIAHLGRVEPQSQG